MNEEELNSIQEFIERKITLAEVTGGLTSSDKKFIALWNYAMQLQNNWNELKKWLENMTTFYNQNKYMEQLIKDIKFKMQELENRKV